MKYGRFLHYLQKSLSNGGKLDLFFTLCLILNTIQMCMYYEEASKRYSTILDYSNEIFTYIYTVEAALKLWSAGCS